MHDLNWLKEGTVYWKREDGNFTVIPAADYVFGMMNPERNVKHGFDKWKMMDLLFELGESFDYDMNLMWDSSIERMGSADKPEMNYLVQSWSRPDLRHVVTLFTIADEIDDKGVRIDSLRNLSYIDHCEKGIHTGRLCAMPYEACVEWGIPLSEWERRQYDSRLSKIRGPVMDRHVVSVVRNLNLYPVFDEARFQCILPKAVEIINDTPKRKKKGKKLLWYHEDLDKSLKSVMDDMGFSILTTYYKMSDMSDRLKDRLVRLYGEIPKTENLIN